LGITAIAKTEDQGEETLDVRERLRLIVSSRAQLIDGDDDRRSVLAGLSRPRRSERDESDLAAAA